MERIAGMLLILVGILIIGFGTVDAVVVLTEGLPLIQILPHAVLLLTGIVITAIGISTLGGR